MSKKKNDEERKPDLNEAEDQAAIEARIKEMMELEKPKPAGKSISVTMHDDESPATAPELPGPKKPLSIKVVDHNELAGEPPEPDAKPSEAPEPEETDPEVLAAIEEANKQLLGEEEAGEPEQDEAIPNEAAEEPEPESEPEPETEPQEKPKPLSHLDSIVPKTKIEETIEDGKTGEAVDDIISKESDALLQAEDEKVAAAFQPEPKASLVRKLRNFLGKKSVRVALLLTVLAVVIAAAIIPGARYFVLNTAGVRSSASLTVLDDSTQQPLRGVNVKIGSASSQTDQEGRALFKGLKLGPSKLVIEKRAFSQIDKQITIGWGSNPLPDFKLAPTGSQYVFTVTDFLSGKPVAKVEAISNEASAISNEQGEIRLTIDSTDETARDVIISGQGYRQEKFPLNLDQKEALPVRLVPARKHVFISKRSGRFDVYKVDVDGKNEKLVLPGTGSERDDMVLISHPSDEVAALVSTKDNKRNKDGFLLSTLTIINLAEDTAKSVVTSERVQIIDWVGSRVVYVAIKDGASASSNDRHKLVSYDYKSQESKDLATVNYFNDVMVAGGKVYYAPSGAYSGGASFFRVDADGSNQQTILNKEVWNIFRTSYGRLALAVQQEWYEVNIGENKAGKISGEPPSQTSRVYVDGPDGKRSLWVDNRDGKGVLLAYDSASKQDAVIRTQGGLKQPVRWLSGSTIVFRINTEAETADYALNLDGGEPRKISDVTNTSGVDRWYFY